MSGKKVYIPLLITFALISLLLLQAKWLYSVYQHKDQELKDKTIQAVIATGKRLQKAEDAKFILKNIDSVLTTDGSLQEVVKEELRVIVSDMKSRSDSVPHRHNDHFEMHEKLIKDSSFSTTVIRINEKGKRKMIIRTNVEKQDLLKNKAKELQSLFLKMAVASQETKKSISSLAEYKEVNRLLNEELKKQGVDLEPFFCVSYLPTENMQAELKPFTICKSPGFLPSLPKLIVTPLLTEGVYNGQLKIEVGFRSTTDFLFKQMAGTLLLSLCITFLIGFVMILVFRRLIDQERLNKIKNDFINNMTHELKTPIATISLAIDAITNPTVKEDPARFNEYSRILKEENQKLNDHVERVLQIALLDRGKVSLKKESIDLLLIMRSVLKDLSLLIESKKAKVSLKHSDESFIYEGEHSHFKSVFSNLLDNALKYSHENCVIDIEMSRTGKQIEVVFRDNGIGIDETKKDKVFERFFREQNGEKHDVKGTGLGLSYVKKILELYKGTITLSSEKGKGSEFTILLPL